MPRWCVIKFLEFLFRDKAERPPPSLVLNITYHPVHSKLKGILSNIHLLLTPDEEHRKIFQDTPMVGFNGKSLKGILVGAKLPKLNQGKASDVEEKDAVFVRL